MQVIALSGPPLDGVAIQAALALKDPAGLVEQGQRALAFITDRRELACRLEL
jgi:hypothetical protein